MNVSPQYIKGNLTRQRPYGGKCFCSPVLYFSCF